MKPITGLKTEEIKLDPAKGKISTKSINMPYRVNTISSSCASFLGRIPTKILPPSNGWTGIRLKMARTTLRSITG